MSQSPRLEEVFDAAIGERLSKFFTAVPARVTFYSPGNCAVDLELQVNAIEEDSKGRQFIHYPKVNSVPVLFPGSGNVRITTPVNEGDLMLYVVSTIPLHHWDAGEQASYVVPPETRNWVGSGFAIPGIFPRNRTPTPAPPTDAIVTFGPTKIGGSTGTQQTFMADTFLMRFNDFLTALETEINAIAPTVGTAIKNAWITTGIKTVFAEVK